MFQNTENVLYYRKIPKELFVTELILSNTEVDFTGNGLCYGGKFLKYFGGSRDKHFCERSISEEDFGKIEIITNYTSIHSIFGYKAK